MDELRVGGVAFLGEKIGPIEDKLKRAIAASFDPSMGIESAYLLRVSYGEGGNEAVALGLKGGEDHALEVTQRAEAIFRRMFSRGASLDIVFLKPTQEQRVTRVAKSFYTRPGSLTPST